MKISEWEPVLARLVSPKRDHIRGPLSAPGDYECPYCGAAQPIIDEIQQQWASDGVIFWSYLSPIAVNPGADGILDALKKLTMREKSNEHTASLNHVA
jgi:hypothetical protein